MSDTLRTHDLVVIVLAIALIALLPWLLASAGSEPAEYRDHRTGRDMTAPAWVGVLVFALPFVVWAGMKAWNRAAKPTAATVGPGGVRLHREIAGLYLRGETPAVDLAWSEVRRMVLWRRRKRWLGVLPGWETRVGVERTDDWYQVSRRDPTPSELQSRGHRKDGSPVRLGSMLHTRSVKLTPRAARRLAAAVARYAMGVEFADERTPGKPRPVEPLDSRG
ncbi:hypothetical protein [Glycomyces endophyticus]|uniref:hypothetical protein n=1 Tax=Glycomyces endophyticus TaxID=480996 RepID=UPI0031D43C36